MATILAKLNPTEERVTASLYISSDMENVQGMSDTVILTVFVGENLT